MFLLAGCSYVDNLDFPEIAFGPAIYRENRAKIIAMGGAGNQYIAQSILDNVNCDTTGVFVLWSGLSRIDVPLPVEMDFEVDQYWHRTKSKNTVWFHSGGYGGTWHSITKNAYAKYVHSYLKAQYTPLDWNYLASLSFTAISGALNLLEIKRIQYRFGFIYDFFQDYSSNTTSLSGAIDRDHHLLDHIPWQHCVSVTPYEFCRDNNLLDTDDFHPSRQGYSTWWEKIKPEVPFGP